MKDKDYGIILSKLDYSENSYILKIYTSKHGLSSFLFRGAKKKKDQFKVYPLSIVEFEYGVNPKSDLHYLNSISTYVNISNCFFDPVKSSILFFLNEILQKTLRESEPDQELLSFIISRLKYLDVDDKPLDFHLHFMKDYSRFLGFDPSLDEEESLYFDLKEGEFCLLKPKHEYFIEKVELEAFKSFIQFPYDGEGYADLKGVKRTRMLQILVVFYQNQLENFGACKTLEVLETIFRD